MLDIDLLPLDTSGTLPSNLVEETQYISNQDLFPVVLGRGLFFGDTLSIRRNSVTLTEGTSWEPTDMDHKLSMDYGRPIYRAVILKATGNHMELLFEYQALGGPGSYDRLSLRNNVDEVNSTIPTPIWNEIKGIQTTYNPVDHLHIFNDIYDFSVVDDLLNDIRDSVLGDKRSLLYSLMDEIRKSPHMVSCETVQHDLFNHEVLTYDTMLYYLSKIKLLGPISIDTDKCLWRRSSVETFHIDTEDLLPGTVVYWELYAPDSTIDLSDYFSTLGGSVQSNEGVVTINYNVPNLPSDLPYFYFYIGAKLDSSQEDYDAVSFRIRIEGNN